MLEGHPDAVELDTEADVERGRAALVGEPHIHCLASIFSKVATTGLMDDDDRTCSSAIPCGYPLAP